MDSKSLILSWIVYAIIEYVGIICLVVLVVYLLRKGKFRQWKERRRQKKLNKDHDNSHRNT